MTFAEFVQRLEALGLKPHKQASGQWLAHCPAHDDQKPSLSFTERNGKVLLCCFAGCSLEQICTSLGISVADLFDRENEDGNGQKAERIVAVYDYRDANGRLLFQTVRFEPKRFAYRQPDNNNGWRWTLEGVPRPLPLYRLPELLQADPQKPVFVVEGEKDADNLWQQGLVATTNPMGAGKWAQVDDSPLEGRHVVILPDNDEVGRKHAEQIAQSLYGRAASVRIVYLPDLPPKGDVSDWLEAGHTVGELLELVSQTPEWQPSSSAAEILEAFRNFVRQGEAPPQSQRCPFCQLSDAELFDLARPVLDAENPLQEAVERVRAAFGIVGEDANLQLLLLALTTRIFPQPVNVLVTGGTGQGKSFLTDAACATLPPCCHRRIVGASARALLFHPLQRGTILEWLELPELGGDTIAATILRSILWQAPQETATDYLFVEWTPKGARRRSVQMPRQVALVTTKVELPKDEQLLSRFLILEVRESADKRKAVLTSLAASFNGEPDALNDDALEPMRAFAEWLGRYKVRVTIPFAYALAELFAELPANERDFRDFSTLLKLVAACALWNLSKRQHSIDGDSLRVTADLSDYAKVYRLLLPVWGKPRSAALSETERRVAEALRQTDSPATAEELAKVVGITDRSVRRALNALAEKGLVERGEKRGRSYEWRLVGDLDALTVILPTPEAVAAAWQPDPTPEQPTTDNEDTFTDIADIHGHEPVSVKNPINAGTSGFTDKRTQEAIQMDDTDSETTVRKLSDIFEADSVSLIGKENCVRDVRDAKNLSGASTFCGHDPMSANVRDVREDAPTEPQKSETELPIDIDSGLDVKII